MGSNKEDNTEENYGIHTATEDEMNQRKQPFTHRRNRICETKYEIFWKRTNGQKTSGG
jgi:hypothetical protein